MKNDPEIEQTVIMDHEYSLEKGLFLVGCIALKDKLQDEVTETIKFIRHRDLIKFWIISGDKTHTIERIAK